MSSRNSEARDIVVLKYLLGESDFQSEVEIAEWFGISIRDLSFYEAKIRSHLTEEEQKYLIHSITPRAFQKKDFALMKQFILGKISFPSEEALKRELGKDIKTNIDLNHLMYTVIATFSDEEKARIKVPKASSYATKGQYEEILGTNQPTKICVCQTKKQEVSLKDFLLNTSPNLKIFDLVQATGESIAKLTMKLENLYLTLSDEEKTQVTYFSFKREKVDEIIIRYLIGKTVISRETLKKRLSCTEEELQKKMSHTFFVMTEAERKKIKQEENRAFFEALRTRTEVLTDTSFAFDEKIVDEKCEMQEEQEEESQEVYPSYSYRASDVNQALKQLQALF